MKPSLGEHYSVIDKARGFLHQSISDLTLTARILAGMTVNAHIRPQTSQTEAAHGKKVSFVCMHSMGVSPYIAHSFMEYLQRTGVPGIHVTYGASEGAIRHHAFRTRPLEEIAGSDMVICMMPECIEPSKRVAPESKVVLWSDLWKQTAVLHVAKSQDFVFDYIVQSLYQDHPPQQPF